MTFTTAELRVLAVADAIVDTEYLQAPRQDVNPWRRARNVMLSLWAAVNEYMEGLEVTKKLSGLVHRNSSSQASSPQK